MTCLFIRTPMKQRHFVQCLTLFDCFNTRHLFEAEHKRNDALLPYTSKEDSRLKVRLYSYMQVCNWCHKSGYKMSF